MAPHRYNTRSSAKKRYRAFFPRRDQKQLKLKECRKVVVLRTSQGCFTAEDLESARLVLEDGNASRQEVLEKLRVLASLEIGYSHLESCGKLAESVGRVTGHQVGERAWAGLLLLLSALVVGRLWERDMHMSECWRERDAFGVLNFPQ